MSLNKTPHLATVSTHLLKNNRSVRPWTRCNFSSEGEKPKIKVERTFNQPPLNESLPGLPTAVYEAAKVDKQFTKVTKLANGLRVASENRFGHFSTIGVVVDAGPRYEVSYPSGTSHFLEKLAFQSTSKYENKSVIQKELEKYGGIGDCQIIRDMAIYAASCMGHGVDSVMSILADMVLRPNITHEELLEAQQTVGFELESLKTKPEQDMLLMDMIHAAAYKDNTLGLPKMCPEKNLYIIDKSVLTTFLKNHYTPHRMVVAGIGVDHDEFVQVVKKYFEDEEPIWNGQKDLIKPESRYGPDASVAQYTGGLVQEVCELPQYNVSGLPELAHVVIGLEGSSFNEEDYIPLCVLNMIMGGGSSFSAGGPGKGMFTRLYLNVLNKHHWISGATSYNQSYIDSGLFFIHACSTPEHIGNTTEVIIKEMVNMTGSFYVDELDRAKKQLQSMLLMNLETKPVVFEDVARQVLANGFRKRPDVYIELIQRVTPDDVRRVASRLLSSPVSVAARGNIAKLPSYNDIQAGLSGRPVSDEKRATSFP